MRYFASFHTQSPNPGALVILASLENYKYQTDFRYDLKLEGKEEMVCIVFSQICLR